MATFTGRFMSGLRAFREAYMTSGMEGVDPSGLSAVYDFESYTGRLTRYDILWAYYQNNAYRSLHKWSKKMKVEYGLYPYIRDIFNPANRICNFHQTHIWGGQLDLEAGDSSEIPSALPIEGADDKLRAAISHVWEWSRWQIEKDIITLYGAVYGDVFLRVVANSKREMVYLERVHPGWVADMNTNNLDELIDYEIIYMRKDPEKPDRMTEYREVAILTEQGVHYQTFRQNQPYSWDGYPEEWVTAVPFIPMVHIKHNDVGIPWGWSELFPSLPKFRELDDQASKLSDQIRKLVDSPWFFAGVKPGKSGGTMTLEGSGTRNTGGAPSEISREETPILYAHDPQAKPHPLVAPMDLAGALAHVRELANEVEKGYPELRGVGTVLGQGDVSGRALLLARQEAEDKMRQRRVNYDIKLAMAQRMAIAIGGDMGLEDFGGFKLEDYTEKNTEHRVKAIRPVFEPHPSEKLDQERALWTNAHLAERVGVDMEIFLRDKEWSDKRIREILESELYKAHLRALVAQADIAEASVEASENLGEGNADENEGKGNISGRSAPSGSQDFDVATNKSREG